MSRRQHPISELTNQENASRGRHKNKTFSKFYYRYTELLRKFGCTCRTLIKQGISHPAFYGNIVYKAHKFKKCPSNLTDHLNRLIHKGYKFNIVVKSLNLVFGGKKY